MKFDNLFCLISILLYKFLNIVVQSRSHSESITENFLELYHDCNYISTRLCDKLFWNCYVLFNIKVFSDNCFCLQVPNMAILMGVYEGVVYMLK